MEIGTKWRHRFERARARLEGRGAVLTVAGIYAVFILYMQYSKHRWVITLADTFRDFLPILHAELSTYLLLVVILVLFVRSRALSFLLLSFYFLISLCDWYTWFIINRPFHFADIQRAIEFVNYFKGFSVLGPDMALKMGIMLITMAPAGFILWALPGMKKKAWDRHVANASLLCLGCYSLLLPCLIGSYDLRWNSMVRMLGEILYEYRLRHTSTTEMDIRKVLGTCPDRAAVLCLPENRDASIVVFVLETTPYRYYHDKVAQFSREVQDAFHVNVWTMREHYTTYPESDRAILSIMTGKYPPLERGAGWVRSYDYAGSLPRVLKESGYKTFMLSTAPLDFHDNRYMMEALGFETIVDSSLAKKALTIKDKARVFERTKLYDADRELISKAQEIIASHPAQPYLLAIAPQASHAPFQRPPRYEGDASQASLIEANAGWQLEQIKIIIRALSEQGRLDRTWVIVTGDHGLRHPAETALFADLNRLSADTFHVPLLFIAGNDLPLTVLQPTSHIDITPTILGLLGIPFPPYTYQGRNLGRECKRSLFWLGGDYLPASGFTSQGRYFMENRNLGLVLKSPRFDFSSDRKSGAVRCTESERRFVAYNLELIKRLLMKSAD